MHILHISAEMKRHYYTKISQLEQLKPSERAELEQVAEKFSFRCNDYYLSLIHWEDPDDPIRKIIIPDIQELDQWGRLDPSNEASYKIIPGMEHKYSSTVLLAISQICEGICRYCFRKRIFIGSQTDYLRDLPAALDYIAKHNEITNVLLTGGDPLTLSTGKLENVISQLRQIDHVQIIRIGTKMPAFNPYRILEDPALPEMIGRYSTDSKAVYFMTHFVHPRELTDPAVKALGLLRRAGAVIANQTPLIRGVNDNPDVLAELLAKLSYTGVAPYYIFQCRPALGNKPYTVPIEEGYAIFNAAISKVSGLAKRLRFVLSHSTGKIEVVGMSGEYTYFKYHRAACEKDNERFMAFRRNPNACWLDDYEEIIRDYPIQKPYRLYGPE